jgi:hypothetical protein
MRRYLRAREQSEPRHLDHPSALHHGEGSIASGRAPARRIVLACSEPPKGHKRWSVRLLADRFVELECAEGPISRELVRRTLKKVP